MEVYKQKEWLYEHYVRKRMSLKDICELLKSKYNITITEQGLYNHVKKNDLLRYRGKGRTLNAQFKNTKRKGKTRQNPARLREQELRKRARRRRG